MEHALLKKVKKHWLAGAFFIPHTRLESRLQRFKTF